MSKDNIDYNEYEEWIMENMYDDSIVHSKGEDSDNSGDDTSKDISEIDEDKDREESALERFRGDGSRTAKISVNRQSQIIIRLLMSILIIFMIFMIIIKSKFNPVTVVGPSMEPTLNDGDILRTSTSIDSDAIEYDTIVCFKKKGPQLIIKRVVGLPGDTISFKDGRVIINGKIRIDGFPLMKEYPKESIVLKENQYYCLGDNRNESADSRILGPVDISEITNIVVFNQTKSQNTLGDVFEEYVRVKNGDYDLATNTDADEKTQKPVDTNAQNRKGTETDSENAEE